MKVITYTMTRLTLSKAEKSTKLSWGSNWKTIMRLNKDVGGFHLLTATWSGYSGQSNCDTTSLKHANILRDIKMHPYKGTIDFTDNTTLEVKSEFVTLKEFFRRGIRQCMAYSSLIDQMIDNGGYLDLNKEKTTKEEVQEKEVSEEDY